MKRISTEEDIKKTSKIAELFKNAGLGFRSRKQFLKQQFEFILKRDKKIKLTSKFIVN